MDKNPKGRQSEEISSNEEELMDRRGFLLGLKKWSKIVIGSALLGSAMLNAGTEKETQAAAAWANRGGGTYHGGGAAWANRAGGGGAAAWANRAGGGGAAWANRGAAWANRGGSWVNRF